jgi:hypothetical protein
MSAASLDDEKPDSFLPVYRLLNRFGSLTSRFSICRGGLAATTTLLVGIYVLILLDSSGWLVDIVRWFASLGVYALSLMLGWHLGGNRIVRQPTTIQLANEIEKRHPHFAERLSSSVELHAAPIYQSADASIFVDTIHNQAYRELKRVNLKGIVPWQSLRRWFVVPFFLLITYVVLSCISGLQFPTRVARAMMPFVEIDAPARWHLRILSPDTSDYAVPSNHNVVFRLQATSLYENELLPQQAILECKESPTSSTRKSTSKEFPLKLETSGSNIYTTIAPVGDSPVEYRFLFGGSKTKWQKISPAPRPCVRQFRWKIDFPAYTLLPSEFRTNELGDLRVLKDSRLELRIEVDQHLHAGSLLVENADTGQQQRIDLQKSQIPTEEGSPSTAIEVWYCKLEASYSSRFQVNLESKNQFLGEHIRNTFSPWYKLETLPDPPAVVDWIATPETTSAQTPRASEPRLIQPDDMITLTGEVRDNLPIVSLSSEVSINDQGWTEIDLQPTSSSDTIQNTDGSYQWEPLLSWDVASCKVSPNDFVSLRLKVVDRAENTSYSPPLHFAIGGTGFSKDRHDVLAKQAALIPLLEKLKIALNTDQEVLLKTIDQFRANGSSQTKPSDDAPALQRIKEWAESASSIANDLQIAIQTLMPQVESYMDQNELELVARAVSRIQRERLNAIRVDCNQQLNAERKRWQEKLPEWVDSVDKETCDRLTKQLKAAGRDAERLLEIYRSLVSLGLQTALTKDMTFLWGHQQKQSMSPSNRDMPSLVRSQRVADRYWQLSNELATRMVPYVRPEFAKRIPEWQNWMENSRQEIRDLCLQNDDANTRTLLLDRIRRDARELEGQRWIYNYDGSLLWSTNELRRELLLQSGSLASQFDALLKIHPRRKNLLRNQNLSSLELAVQNRTLIRNAEAITDSIAQLTDRRDIHALRKHQDPKFGSDMGLAWRAWNAVFVLWKTETAGDVDRLANDLKVIYGAYRTLEAAHEVAEAKLALTLLQSSERYDFQSLNGQLQHYRQWESISSRLETAQQWMRAANFPTGISDRYNAIRQSKPFASAQSKLAARRDPQNKNLLSAAQEVDTLLGMWNEQDRLAQPVIEEARRILSQFAPSIVDLAKRAADSTRQLQQQTTEWENPETIAKNNEADEKIREQQNRVLEQVKILEDALIEQAAQQNLLQQSQRELARDSDRALSLLEDVTKKMNESLADAFEASQESPSDSSQTKNTNGDSNRENAIRQAKSDQQKAVEAFESIARHFDDQTPTSSQNQASQPETSSASLADQLSAQDPSNEQKAEEYQRAEALERQLRESPEETLKQLEAELRKSPLMQDELSAISKTQASNAAAELKRAADTEQDLRLRIENDDAELFEAKKSKSDRLNSLAVLAERTAAKMLERAAQMSQRANLDENQTTIQSSHQRLKNAIDDVRQVNEQTPAAEQDLAIAKLASRFAEIAVATQSAAEMSKRSINRPSEKSEQNRINKVNEAKNAQNSLRDEMAHNVKQITNQWRDASKHAQQRVTQLRKEADTIESQRSKWLQSQKGNLGQESVQEELRQWTSRLDQSIARWKDASLSEKTFEELSDVVETQWKSSIQDRASLDQPNPYAALATEQLANANKWLDELVRQARKLETQPLGAKPPAPAASSLEPSAAAQTDLRLDLARIAGDVDRSARHEQRLGNDQGSSQLQEQSNAIRETENGIVKTAEKSLLDKSQEAKNAERTQSKPDAKGNVTQRLTRPSAATAREQLGQAEEALKARAKELASLAANSRGTGPSDAAKQTSNPEGGEQPSDGSTQPPTDSASPSANAPPRPNSSTPMSSAEQAPANQSQSAGGAVQQKASDLARMLDQLDRDIYAQQSPTETGDSKQNGETDVSRSEPSSGSNKIRNGKGNMSSARQSAIESSAQQLASEMNQSRMEQKNRNPGGQTYLRNQKGAQSGGEGAKGPNPMERAEDYFLPNSQSSNDRDWGKLRTQRAVDVKEGTRESFDPEFDQAIRAYYQAIGDAASGK